MEARYFRLTLCALACGLIASLPTEAFAASYRTGNFIITARTRELAEQIGTAAEDYRRELALEWLGYELPRWSDPCPITAHVDQRTAPSGVTSFMFRQGRPYGWKMAIHGNRQRVLDSVLPHEITHTIFATHFGCPLPRWADEGACTTVEHISERQKQQEMLIEFLTTDRGIAFNRMFAMREYPRDIMPLYSQGYSLARFLIAQRGKQHFIKFVGDGIDTGDWTAATQRHYNLDSLADLQLTWLDWVRSGSPETPTSNVQDGQTLLASNVDRISNPKRRSGIVSDDRQPEQVASLPNGEQSWYLQRRREAFRNASE